MNTADRFRALKSLRLEGLLPYFDEVFVRAGDELAVEGRLCHQFFVVVDGALETCRGGVRGKLVAGQGFGWAAMRERGVNEASVRAVGDARLLVMGHEQFRAADALELSTCETAALGWSSPLVGRWRRRRRWVQGLASPSIGFADTSP
jgi:CRP-like cAMP-binding protein